MTFIKSHLALNFASHILCLGRMCFAKSLCHFHTSKNKYKSGNYSIIIYSDVILILVLVLIPLFMMENDCQCIVSNLAHILSPISGK